MFCFLKSEDELDNEIESEIWTHGSGQDCWQIQTKTICERTSHLCNNSEMSDLDILACDENWWFGQTVKDYVVRKIFKVSIKILKIIYNRDRFC
jgi:hypothetical protein